MNWANYLASQVGKTASVIVEKPRTGRTEHFAVVELDKDCEPGNIVEASIMGATAQTLQARAA